MHSFVLNKEYWRYPHNLDSHHFGLQTTLIPELLVSGKRKTSQFELSEKDIPLDEQ